ncbi:hypothetical protein EUX98_g1648 [Antrodiella citrinella]|uniref:Lipoyl-binding domain-containing protein n=1 Tax=Antrodiella citrinella TaxID=2447956 RepID=A0A4S4N3C6_9APHY|nr:hypothetical protein EUX98_g1648 [Antrodiella citrinella]
MTEGGVSSWKKQEGESFSVGDVLLEIETDKAFLELDAQEDGILAKILAPDGTKGISIGAPIALLAEEGDDISNVEIPKYLSTTPPPAPSASGSQPEQSSPPPSTPPKSEDATPSTHVHPTSTRPLFPSVLRLLAANGISEADSIKGTGVRGMITKGDVLAHLGKASGPLGTYKAFLDKEAKEKAESQKSGGAKPVEKKPEPLDGLSLRQTIVASMLNVSVKARNPPATSLDFDSIISDYLPKSKSTQPLSSPAPVSSVPPKTRSGPSNYLDGLF